MPKTHHSARTEAAIAASLPFEQPIEDHLSFVGDLGFDSLRVAMLSVALENELGQAILLNDWLASRDDPMDLTVGSLKSYVAELMAGGDQDVI